MKIILLITLCSFIITACESNAKKTKLNEAINVADMCLVQGNLDRAFGIYTNVINATSNKEMLAHVYTNRGIVLMQAGSSGAAKEDFEKNCKMGNKQGCKYIAKLQYNGN